MDRGVMKERRRGQHKRAECLPAQSGQDRGQRLSLKPREAAGKSLINQVSNSFRVFCVKILLIGSMHLFINSYDDTVMFSCDSPAYLPHTS